MNTNELIITSLLKKDCHFSESQEKIGGFISEAMLKDPELKALHAKERIYKGYVFSNFYPLGEQGVYKSGQIYVWRIRAISLSLLKKIKVCITKLNSPFIKVIATEIKTSPQKHISELYTINPTILTLKNNQPFLPNSNISLLINTIQGNLEKKYKYFIDQNVEFGFPFIRYIKILNKKPIKIRYKNMSMLGNKVKIQVSEDEGSQKLAQIAVNCGINEKNSILGCGFVFANFTY
ncbi:CRISPR-associated endoribonuclease Cas6 [Terrilactibacillus sp. BCM23-1]|uniref:CRISPR-associated endoribonuclease Cas6 n=1 Tax=Terrilactibacillus tamarindi TaxID=2599694 RepID=A0A6N8CMS5_9BACI|nr:CRISPR-associated endoribonuclease Cas6 [Terrilactibacillus tamarindi]MTT31379.1 CRISPR-associated endoribonuclease Cas6 [Terrilactibacillus tamarindi]